MFKFEIHQTVWYLDNNTVHSAPILSRKYVDNFFSSKNICTPEQKASFAKLGTEGIMYGTIHGVYPEIRLFESREALAESIMIPAVASNEIPDTSVLKFKIDQTVWYIMNNTVHSGSVLSRKYVDNYFTRDKIYTTTQDEAFCKFGKEEVVYATIDGVFPAECLFESKDALNESL